MNLFKLKEDKEILESDIKSESNRIELIKQQLNIHGIDYAKDRVQSSPKSDQVLTMIAEFVDLEEKVKQNINKLEIINQQIICLEEIFKKFNEKNQKIYTEKKLLKWSNAKISINHDGISKRTINRICKKIEKNMECVPPCPTCHDNMIV